MDSTIAFAYIYIYRCIQYTDSCEVIYSAQLCYQVSNPEKERRHGKCPLTPEEVGLMLRALGYGEEVHIYVASGEIYGGNKTLAPLKALFPNFHSKETLASKKELAPFASFSSRMAALDFVVCDRSDAFVTNNNGNMAKILAGRRYEDILYFDFGFLLNSLLCLAYPIYILLYFLQELNFLFFLTCLLCPYLQH